MIRAATAADLEAIVAIARRAFVDPWSEAAFASELGNADASVVVTEDLSGFAIVRFLADEAELIDLAVLPERQGRGLGHALLAHVLALAAARGASSMYLEVRATNAPAVALYHRAGFAQVGLRRGYYAHDGADALLMARTLGHVVG